MTVGELADGDTVAGFVLVTAKDPDYLKVATVGDRVMLPSFEPPWIVVDHTLERVLVTRWPGRLFRAEVVPPATDEERAAMARAGENLRPDAGYTRAFAVDLREEISPSLLFGPHGDAVIRVLAAGLALDEEGARSLASARHPAAGQEYSKAWHRWLAELRDTAHYRDQDHASTLSIHGAAPSGSPIGCGFSVLWQTVRTSAELRCRAGSFTIDEDGDEVLLDPWRTALGALLDAAMAFGAPHLVDSHAAAVLTTAWNVVFESAEQS
ncbi:MULTISPECIES: hypothetical protein [unclassified Kitasatospora]|uniref:hypothetical protein n=1 Tax=unclassified Kitasatospora TaxID=2633591 RepID=UPI00070E742D|nr:MULTISPECIES: hypothetical protein [unclassified Kitasatospora]